VVSYVRGVTRVRQIGHTGTLDPFATGLLILLLGDATKKAAEFHRFPKTYEATVELGCTTDSYDRTGAETSRVEGLEVIHRPTVEEQLMEFVGDIVQGLLAALDRWESACGEIFNIGSDVETTTGDGLALVERLTVNRVGAWLSVVRGFMLIVREAGRRHREGLGAAGFPASSN
jgi:hypothetical protein